jgi:LysR family transcriptional regulator, hydrogen peroxide-inducible genes activator
MEIHQVRYFLAVCEQLNFTRAARQCHVTQPSLTRAIKLLEAEFGGPLFRRTRGHSHLTALGEIVRPHLEKVWEKSEAAVASAREFAPASHPLEVSTPAWSKPIRDCER